MANLTNVIVTKEHVAQEDEFHALFADIEELEPFEIKKEEIAAHLAALLSFAKVTRSTMARKTGWKRSRITNVLNGNGNPTYKTLWEFARKLGYEADLNFRLPNEKAAEQPWQRKKIEATYLTLHTGLFNTFDVHAQTASEVADDILNNREKSMYFSLTQSNKNLNTFNSSGTKFLTQSIQVPFSISDIYKVKEAK